jgi:hypothetical protein
VAEELKNNFDIEAELKNGYLGSFDIYIEGENIFSFSELGRYPKTDEITTLLRERFPDRLPEKAGE